MKLPIAEYTVLVISPAGREVCSFKVDSDMRENPNRIGVEVMTEIEKYDKALGPILKIERVGPERE